MRYTGFVDIRRAAALMPIVLGAFVAMAWLFKPDWLAAIAPAVGVMVFNAALCILLLGCATALLDLSPSTRRVAAALGAVVCVVAGWTLLEHGGWVPGLLDNPALHRPVQPQAPAPGRMASGTSLALLLLGVTALLWPFAVRRSAAILIHALVIFAGVIAVMGLLIRELDLEFLYSRYVFSDMAVHTSIGLAAIAICYWLAWHRASWNVLLPFASDTDRIVSYGIAIVLGVTLFAGVLTLYVYDEALERTLAEQQMHVLEARATLVATTLEHRTVRARAISTRPALVMRLRARNAASSIESDPAIEAIAQSWLALGFAAVEIRDAAGRTAAQAGRFSGEPFELPLRSKPDSVSIMWADGLHLLTEMTVFDNGRAVGTVRAEQFLSNVTQALFDGGRSGGSWEIELCGRKGAEVACFPTRLTGVPYNYPHNAISNDSPIHSALRGRAGNGYGRDLGRNLVYSSYGPVGDSGLGIVVKSSVQDVKRPIREELQRVLPGLAVVLVIGSVLLRLLIRPLAHKLATREQQLQLALEASQLALWDLNMTTRQVYVSGAWDAMVGGAESGGRTVPLSHYAELVHPDDAPRVAAHLRDVLSRKVSTYDIEHRVRMADGQWVWIHSRGHVIEWDAQGRALRLAGTNANVSLRKAAEADLYRQATHDGLTDLPNRGLLQDRLGQAVARSQRNHTLIAVCYLDIDHLKAINDTYGHAAGDELLRQFSDRLTQCVRTTDTVARLGGDEFAVVLEPLITASDAEALGEKIVTAMREAFVLSGATLGVTTSVGIALHDGGSDITAAELLERADAALYRAKTDGRNRHVLT